MKKTKTTRYDVAEHLRTPEEMAVYLEACFEEGGNDAGFIAKALGDIAREPLDEAGLTALRFGRRVPATVPGVRGALLRHEATVLRAHGARDDIEP